jgi:GNAT superfamily N-acetyltransferase
VRPAVPQDAGLLRSIARATWPAAYGTILSQGQIEYMLDLMYTIPLLEAQIRGSHCFSIAERRGRSVGFAGYEHKYKGDDTTRLHKFYVLPDSQQAGVGRTLFESLVRSARAAGDTVVELNVNRHNPTKEVYRKWGFAVLRDEVIQLGEGYVMDDHVMVLDLHSGTRS